MKTIRVQVTAEDIAAADEHHPEILAARAEPHAFVPFPGEGPDHHDSARCVCHACWEPKGNRRMHPRRLA